MNPLLICAALFVVDGDTIRCNDARVRLWGIDAPEMSEPDGHRSRRHLVVLTRGQRVVCRPRGRDRYRRVVARCFVGTTDLACAMVAAGHAKDWPRYSRGFYALCGGGEK